MSCISAFPLTVLLFLLSSPFFFVHGCPPHELSALLTFKSTVDDPQGMLNSWTGDRCCSWTGVKCNETREGRHVSMLDLGGFWLSSEKITSVSSLLELRHLRYLDLSDNYFQEEIPSELGNLSSLRHLDLSSSFLRASNLHWLSNLSSLEYLSLKGVNVIDKRWESIIGSLLHLQHLDLSWCSLRLAPNISNARLRFSSLAFLDLSGNSISNIPAWMGSLSSLTHLHFRENSISNIPAWMGNLSSLTHLYLSRNDISGSIPNTVGKLPSSLTHLDLTDNNISGSLPYPIGNLTGLEYLDLSYNALTEIHPSLGHNSRQNGSLRYLSLGVNNLEGTIPSSLGLLCTLTYLDLGWNKLRGNIPPTLGNLHKLTYLDLGWNNLRGNIPPTLGNLHKLKTLYLWENQLSGSLPLSVFQLSSLTSLDASDNHLNGSIPSALMLPASLQNLDLSYNMMNGTITELFFQKSLKLEQLDLSHSGLRINISSTWIPSFQLWSLSLRKCLIGGPIPSWISTQFNLHHLDLSGTQLMGNLPS